MFLFVNDFFCVWSFDKLNEIRCARVCVWVCVCVLARPKLCLGPLHIVQVACWAQHWLKQKHTKPFCAYTGSPRRSHHPTSAEKRRRKRKSNTFLAIFHLFNSWNQQDIVVHWIFSCVSRIDDIFCQQRVSTKGHSMNMTLIRNFSIFLKKL